MLKNYGTTPAWMIRTMIEAGYCCFIAYVCFSGFTNFGIDFDESERLYTKGKAYQNASDRACGVFVPWSNIKQLCNETDYN